MTPRGARPAEPPGPVRGIRSVTRAFSLLETVGRNNGGMGLTELAAESGLPVPSIHRVVHTLVDLGYLRRVSSRQYALGSRLLVLADCSATMMSAVARPYLSALVDDVGETANLAVLEGDHVVYLAQVPSRHSLRIVTEPGRRALPHCTALGKALLTDLPDDDVVALLGRTGMPRHTDRTVVEPAGLVRRLRRSAADGYAVDDGEQEPGLTCVAAAVPGLSSRLALSVSGPAGRLDHRAVRRAGPVLTAAAAALASALR